MKNPRLINARYCPRALTISSAVSLLAFGGCSSIGTGAANHGLTTSLLMGHIGPVEEESGDRPVAAEPDYEWFY
jgi:hypothetical protein